MPPPQKNHRHHRRRRLRAQGPRAAVARRRLSLRDLCECRGIPVAVARTCGAACLLVSDVHLGGMTGLQLALHPTMTRTQTARGDHHGIRRSEDRGCRRGKSARHSCASPFLGNELLDAIVDTVGPPIVDGDTVRLAQRWLTAFRRGMGPWAHQLVTRPWIARQPEHAGERGHGRSQQALPASPAPAGSSGNASAPRNRLMVKPIPVSTRHAATWRQVTPERQGAEAETHGQPGEAEHAGQFCPSSSPSVMPSVTGCSDRRPRSVHERHAGIGQRKQRQDQQTLPRDAANARGVAATPCPSARGQRNCQPQRHAGQRGVNTGLEHRKPQQESQRCRYGASRATPARLSTSSSARQTAASDSASQDNCCVNNTAISTMAPRSSMTASASRKMRSAGGAPRPSSASTPSANAMSVAVGIGQPAEQQRLRAIAPGIHQRRNQHATHRGDGGQQGAAAARKVAHHALALDLDADQQEEHGHEAVVDPVQHGLGERQRRDADRDRPQQQFRVVRAQRRIRDQHRGRHRGHQCECRARIAFVGVPVAAMRPDLTGSSDAALELRRGV